MWPSTVGPATLAIKAGTRTMVAALGLALLSCDRGPIAKEEHAVPRNGEVPTAPKPPKPPEAAGTADAVAAREVPVPSSGGEPGKVRVRLPASWSLRAQSLVLEDEFREAVAGVQFDLVCQKCTDEDVARFGTTVDSTFGTRVRPNINTGDPALDAVRMELALVEEGKLPDGQFRVARVTRPPGLEGPYREQLYAVCVRGRRGGQAMAAQGWAPLAREVELGSIIVEACKTFEILP
jgi:hypothetical protein